MSILENRVESWVRTRIGDDHMNRKERALRLLEESIELAQSEGIAVEQVDRQVGHVYSRPDGEPKREAGAVAVCLFGYCAAIGEHLHELALAEIERLEAKPIPEIRASLDRKSDAGLMGV